MSPPASSSPSTPEGLNTPGSPTSSCHAPSPAGDARVRARTHTRTETEAEAETETHRHTHVQICKYLHVNMCTYHRNMCTYHRRCTLSCMHTYTRDVKYIHTRACMCVHLRDAHARARAHTHTSPQQEKITKQEKFKQENKKVKHTSGKGTNTRQGAHE